MQRRTIGTRRAVVLALMVAGALVISVITDSLPADGGQPPAPGIRVAQRFRPRGGLRPAPDTGDDELGLDGVFLPPDRTAKRRLELAQELLGERRFGEGVRLLGALLENAEDFFFKPAADEPVYRSLKAEAGRLIAELPAEGRASYELQFGARAPTAHRGRRRRQPRRPGRSLATVLLHRRRPRGDVPAGPPPSGSRPAAGGGLVAGAAARHSGGPRGSSRRCR